MDVMDKNLGECLLAGIVAVKFTKADGSLREMRCTRNTEYLPELTEEEEEEDRVVREDLEIVFDVDLQEWRSFKPSRIINWNQETV